MPIEKLTKPSEIIAGAMKLFGADGGGWNNHTLQGVRGDKDTYCAIGGLQKVAFGKVVSSGGSSGACLKTEQLVRAEITGRYTGHSIPVWNDSRPSNGFVQIKKVFCAALKTALAQERKAVTAKRKGATKNAARKSK